MQFWVAHPNLASMLGGAIPMGNALQDKTVVVVGRGSGIFLHAQTGRATRGCVSLREHDLLAVLRWLRPDTRILIGTTAWLRSRK